MPSDNPFLGNLFPDDRGDPNAPEVLYGRTVGLFPSGSYLPNPLSDPSSGGRGLADWWKSSFEAMRGKTPPRKQLPESAQFDKNWVDNMCNEIYENLRQLEGAPTPKDRRGYANIVTTKFSLLQSELPLEALAAVPELRESTTTFRDACFTAAKGVVARTLNDDRPGESARETYLQLERSDAAATHYALGGDPPDSLRIPKGEPAGIDLAAAVEGLDVPVGESAGSSFGAQFSNLLIEFGMTQNKLNGWSTPPPTTSAEQLQFAADQQRFASIVDRIANLAQSLGRQARNLVTYRNADEDAIARTAEMAMVCGEAMRNVTGAIRDGAEPGVTEDPTEEMIRERREAGRKAATRLREKIEERDPLRESPGPRH